MGYNLHGTAPHQLLSGTIQKTGILGRPLILENILETESTFGVPQTRTKKIIMRMIIINNNNSNNNSNNNNNNINDSNTNNTTDFYYQ